MDGAGPGLRRLLVFSQAGIGDTLMATPVLRALRSRFPEARIEVVVMWPGSAQLLEGNPNVDHVHAFNLIERPRLEGLAFLAGLRRLRADASLTLHPQGRREYRVVAWIAGARRRLSHRYENQGWLDRLLVTDAIDQDYAVSCAENNLRLVRLLGGQVPDETPRYELFLAESERAWARGWLRDQGLEGRDWLGIHVGSGGNKNLALRRWPVGRWAEFLGAWHGQWPSIPVVAFGGPGEREAHEVLARSLPPAMFRVAASPSLRAACALVGSARAFVSVDTAFMHIAAAMRVPHQVVIETPTLNPPVHPLREDWVRVHNPAVAGRSLDFYRYDGRPVAGTDEALVEIMRSVGAEAVLEAVGRPWASGAGLGRITDDRPGEVGVG